MLGDTRRTIDYSTTNWGMTQWVERHCDEFIARNPRVSIFGADSGEPFPHILGVHTVIYTSDGYVLLSLRGTNVHYYKLTWSASYEEQVDLGNDPDQTILDRLARGLGEEFLPTRKRNPNAFRQQGKRIIQDTSLLAIGRDFIRETDRQIFTSTVLSVARLNVPLSELWAGLDRRREIQDREEHLAWMGVRFRSLHSLLDLLRSSRAPAGVISSQVIHEMAGLGIEVDVYNRSTREGMRPHHWMPTSPLRLALAGEWLDKQGVWSA